MDLALLCWCVLNCGEVWPYGHHFLLLMETKCRIDPPREACLGWAENEYCYLITIIVNYCNSTAKLWW